MKNPAQFSAEINSLIAVGGVSSCETTAQIVAASIETVLHQESAFAQTVQQLEDIDKATTPWKPIATVDTDAEVMIQPESRTAAEVYDKSTNTSPSPSAPPSKTSPFKVDMIGLGDGDGGGGYGGDGDGFIGGDGFFGGDGGYYNGDGNPNSGDGNISGDGNTGGDGNTSGDGNAGGGGDGNVDTPTPTPAPPAPSPPPRLRHRHLRRRALRLRRRITPPLSSLVIPGFKAISRCIRLVLRTTTLTALRPRM